MTFLDKSSLNMGMGAGQVLTFRMVKTEQNCHNRCVLQVVQHVPMCRPIRESEALFGEDGFLFVRKPQKSDQRGQQIDLK